MAMNRREFLAAPLAAAAVSADTSDWQGVERVVAVGDVHGDKDAFAAVLRMAGLIDAHERWTGGRAHLVQIGDIPSRGPQTRQAFDFLMRLELDANAAGGRVHALIGNHDAGVIYGDLRNILPAEYAEFSRQDSTERLAMAFDREVAALRKAGRLPKDSAGLDGLKHAWYESHPPGFVEHREAFGPSGHYGSWIRRNNSLIRINDTLFVHGGISPRFGRRSRTELNEAIRKELADPTRLLPGTATTVEGPLWFRGLAEGDETGMTAHLEQSLGFHGVRRIVLGHTVTRSAILPRHGGKVVNIDLGLSRFYGRPPACLVMERSSAHVLHAGTKIPLPGPGEFNDYLRAVIAADSQPSPVERLLRESEIRQ